MKEYYRHALPHIQPIGGTFFVTSCLYNTVPKIVAKSIKEKMNAIKEGPDKEKESKKVYMQFLDNILTIGKMGQHHFKNPAIAEILADKIHQYDQQYYHLIAFVIMSNHFHILVDFSIQEDRLAPGEQPTDDNYMQLYKVMRLIKGGSAFAANKVLKRKGTFWERESYDRLVRDDREFYNVVRYIANNPVKAGIINHWKKWDFTYVHRDYLWALPE